ncbi:hypothetical protein [Pseudomonas sp. S3_H06]
MNDAKPVGASLLAMRPSVALTTQNQRNKKGRDPMDRGLFHAR